MRAVGLTDFDSGLALLDLPQPEPAANELLVSVRTSSINPVEVQIGVGAYRHGEFEFPCVPGMDFAGVVEAVGPGASRFSAGDEVFGHLTKPVYRDGAWAEYITISQDASVELKPESLTFEQAGAFPLAAITAQLGHDGVLPKRGELVLIPGAGGAVGLYQVQLAAREGAVVIATAKPFDEERIRSLGASETIDYSSQDIAEAVRGTHPEGVDVLLDLINDRPELERLAELVKDGGRVASVRYAASRKLGERGIAVTNVVAAGNDPEVFTRLVELVKAGELQVSYDRTCTLEELPGAVGELADGGRGKVVVTI